MRPPLRRDSPLPSRPRRLFTQLGERSCTNEGQGTHHEQEGHMSKATKTDKAIAADEAQLRSVTTGEVLREKGLCPAVVVRTRDAGVHLGYLADYSHRDGSPLGVVELVEGRQLWWWGSENHYELHSIAERGAPRAKISEPCSRPYTVAGVCSVMELTPAAAENLLRTRWES